MQDKNYKVCRKNVHVGIVVEKKADIEEKTKTNNLIASPRQLYIPSYIAYRNMLFTLTDTNQADDLLYNTVSYPILNITTDYICQNPNNKIVINNAYNLDKLLEYFGFNEELSYEDIERISKTFFNAKFSRENCELFGFKRIDPSTITPYDYYDSNSYELTPEQRIKGRKIVKIGNYYFAKVKDSELSSEYFEILYNGMNTLFKDAFKPHRYEGKVGNGGKVRRLTIK